MEIMKFYLVYVPLGIIATIAIIYYLKNKTNEQRYKFIIYLSILTILLHLIKPFFAPYNMSFNKNDPNLDLIISFPSILRKITFENVCAVSALVYLPILLLKKKIPLDYIVTIGLIGGFAAFMYPTEVILGQFDSVNVSYKLKLFSFDTIRFYLVHFLIFIIPFILLYFKMHKMELKRSLYLSLSVLTMMSIVLLNEFIIYKLGWLDNLSIALNMDVKDLFYSHNYRNSSFVYGIPDSLAGIGKIITILVPNFMKNIPIIWILIPAFIYAPLIYISFMFASDFKDTKLQFKLLFNKSKS